MRLQENSFPCVQEGEEVQKKMERKAGLLFSAVKKESRTVARRLHSAAFAGAGYETRTRKFLWCSNGLRVVLKFC